MGRISSGYGRRTDPVTGAPGSMHNGVDFPAQIGSPVYTNTELTVQRAGNISGYGNAIIATDRSGVQYTFGHLDSIPDEYSKGTVIPPGGLVAYTGNTGERTTGAHLHFETKQYDPVTGKMQSFDPTTNTDPFNGGVPYINNMSFNSNGGSLKSTNPQVAAGYVPKNGTNGTQVASTSKPTTRSLTPTIPKKGAGPLPGARAPSSYVDLSVNPVLKLGDA